MGRLLSLITLSLLVAGCGGGESAEPGDPSGSSDSVEVAALGDSITAGSPLYDPDPDAQAALGFGDDEESQYEYWAAEENPQLEFSNCGVFGERTDEIAARLADCAEGSEVLVIQGGINDIAQALADGPDAALAVARQSASNIEGMIQQGKSLDLDVVVVNVLPWNNGHPEADKVINQLNTDLSNIAKLEEVPLIDFHGALEDPDEPGVMAPELTDDGDHPSVEGYRVLGELVAKELSKSR